MPAVIILLLNKQTKRKKLVFLTNISAIPSADEDPGIFKCSSVMQKAYRTRTRDTVTRHFHYNFGSNLGDWPMQASTVANRDLISLSDNLVLTAWLMAFLKITQRSVGDAL